MPLREIKQASYVMCHFDLGFENHRRVWKAGEGSLFPVHLTMQCVPDLNSIYISFLSADPWLFMFPSFSPVPDSPNFGPPVHTPFSHILTPSQLSVTKSENYQLDKSYNHLTIEYHKRRRYE